MGAVLEDDVADGSQSFAVGNFDGRPIQRLGEVLREKDEDALSQRLLREFGIEDKTFAAVLFESVNHCRRGAKLYPQLGELTVSFNGGKDACVVLYLWLAVLLAIDEELHDMPRVIFFDSGDEFVEVQRFVTWAVRSLDLEMIILQNQSFRDGMESLVADNVRAVVMGQRSGDPWMDAVDAFTPSTDGWPAFMRINPIVNWSYHHVWIFLRQFGFPYCELYDQGYTSLGGVADTKPNPALKRPDGNFAPAFELQDGSLERDGRSKSKAKARCGEKR